MLELLGLLPRAVIALELTDDHQLAGSGAEVAAAGQTTPAILPTFHSHKRRRQPVQCVHQGCTGQCKVSEVGAVGPFAVIDAVDDLGDQSVDIQITLTMPVAAEVQRYVVQQSGEVGAVVQIKAAQEVLVGLAAAGVLSGDEARNHFQQLGHPQQRADRQVGAAHRAFTGRCGDADQALRASEDQHLFQRLLSTGQRRPA